MPKCRTCEKEYRADETSSKDQICALCRHKLALPPEAPPLPPRRLCASCKGGSFIRAALRERGIEGISPLAVTFATRAYYSPSGDKSRGGQSLEPNSLLPIGCLEAYICRTCGYTELYTRDFEKIPIGPEFGTELLEASADGPYR